MFRFDVFKIIGNFFYDSDFLYQYRFHHSFFTENTGYIKKNLEYLYLQSYLIAKVKFSIKI